MKRIFISLMLIICLLSVAVSADEKDVLAAILPNDVNTLIVSSGQNDVKSTFKAAQLLRLYKFNPADTTLTLVLEQVAVDVNGTVLVDGEKNALYVLSDKEIAPRPAPPPTVDPTKNHVTGDKTMGLLIPISLIIIGGVVFVSLLGSRIRHNPD